MDSLARSPSACIVTFWTSTIVSELFLDRESVIAVKNAVLTGMWVLIPTMAATGGSGFHAGTHPWWASGWIKESA